MYTASAAAVAKAWENQQSAPYLHPPGAKSLVHARVRQHRPHHAPVDETAAGSSACRQRGPAQCTIEEAPGCMISRGWSERIFYFLAPRGSAVGKPPDVSPRDRNNKTDRTIHRPRGGTAITGADRRGNLRGSLRDAQAQAAAVGAQQPVAKSTGC